MFRRFSPIIFASFVVIYFVYLRYTYLINFAIDDGNKVTKWQQTVAPIFLVLRYPAWLFWSEPQNSIEAVLAIAINCIIYGLLLERLWYILSRRRRILMQTNQS